LGRTLNEKNEVFYHFKYETWLLNEKTFINGELDDDYAQDLNQKDFNSKIIL
jgi:hypothetical protein